MTKYILTRIGWIFLVLITILSLSFSLLKLAPEYPPAKKEDKLMYYNKQVSDGYMEFRRITDAVEKKDIINKIKTGTVPKGYFYEDKGDYIRAFSPVPISKQYFIWAKKIITKWDWGNSTRVEAGKPAFGLLKERIPTTMRINLISLIFYIPVGIILGITSALQKNKPIDNVIQFAVMIMISVPSFVVMVVLVMIFGYQLEWLPSIFPAKDASLSLQIGGLVLPVLAMAFYPIASLTRYTRAELTEILTSEFLLLARTKGLTRKQAIIRHAMRNSMVPLVPTIIFSFVALLSGSVVIERIYSIPGTGSVFINALAKNAYDYNLILVSTAFYTIISLFAVLIVDLSYGLVDPRIRIGGKM